MRGKRKCLVCVNQEKEALTYVKKIVQELKMANRIKQIDFEDADYLRNIPISFFYLHKVAEDLIARGEEIHPAVIEYVIKKGSGLLGKEPAFRTKLPITMLSITFDIRSFLL